MKELKNVEIFAAGTWNGFKFVQEDLEEIANNSNKLLMTGKSKPPVKLGHAKKQILAQDDGQPALGWLENFQVQGKKLLADITNIPDVLFQSFEKGLYKTVSIELKHIQNFGWHSVGLAILGADLPAVKTLNDLKAFLSETNIEPTENFSLVFSEPQISKQSEKVNMSEEKTNLEVEKLKLELERVQAEKTSLENQTKIFQEKERLHSFSVAKENFLSTYQKDVKEGKLIPATLTKIESSINSQQVGFKEGQSLVLDSELMQTVIEGYREAGSLFSEQGQVDSRQEEIKDIEESIIQGVNQVIENTGKNYDDASKVYFSAHPDVAKEYHNHGCKISFEGGY